ncbi:hypothetical protein EDD37DRAFT_605744 [Exophiala viscosa]|uniref:Uncharacterized protein n=1 Tax=Exophiala viscosa TaxID=2486360 RepID=A0AAN6IHI1_9EURO|nr:hypothetical protein EDD36DRAFT_424961 [Exophiala viscosa]KAI1626915.1 hypothetical protein EDD37DRAFT_605744 [Exophiala viscosa]
MSVVDLTMQLPFQAHVKHDPRSASSVLALADALDSCDDEYLRKCIPLLGGTMLVLALNSESNLSYTGSLMILHMFELGCLGGLHHSPYVWGHMDFAFCRAEPKLCQQGVLLPAMTKRVTELLKCRRPGLGGLIISTAKERDLYVKAGEHHLAMEDQNLLIVSPDGDIAFLRPPFFRLELLSPMPDGAEGPAMVFEDALMLGTCTLPISTNETDCLRTLHRLESCLNRLSHRFDAEERRAAREIEMIDPR